jgi:hypothetical protein
MRFLQSLQFVPVGLQFASLQADFFRLLPAPFRRLFHAPALRSAHDLLLHLCLRRLQLLDPRFLLGGFDAVIFFSACVCLQDLLQLIPHTLLDLLRLRQFRRQFALAFAAITRPLIALPLRWAVSSAGFGQRLIFCSTGDRAELNSLVCVSSRDCSAGNAGLGPGFLLRLHQLVPQLRLGLAGPPPAGGICINCCSLPVATVAATGFPPAAVFVRLTQLLIQLSS